MCKFIKEWSAELTALKVQIGAQSRIPHKLKRCSPPLEICLFQPTSQVVILGTLGRGRSGGVALRVAIWMKPATNSCGSSASPWLRKSRSKAIGPLSQLAPQPDASAALSRAKHTAPAERVCSTSGMLSHGFGEATTATANSPSLNCEQVLTRFSSARPRLR